MPLKVDAVVFYRVVDPSVWVTRVKNGYQATHTLAQTTLRATLGAHTLTDILTQRTGITKRMEVSETLPQHYICALIKELKVLLEPAQSVPLYFLINIYYYYSFLLVFKLVTLFFYFLF